MLQKYKTKVIWRGILDSFTWLVWNFLTIAIHGSFGYELDPVLHFGHPGINTLAGTLAAIAHHPDLGKSI